MFYYFIDENKATISFIFIKREINTITTAPVNIILKFCHHKNGKYLLAIFNNMTPKVNINNFKIKDKDYKIVINGLLSGYEVDSLNMVITKDIRSIYIQAIDKSIEKDCINCGMCHTLCPVGADVRTGYKMDKCIKCRICSYVCPAKINFKSRCPNE